MLTKILQICIAIMCLLILFVLLWDLQQRSLQGNNMLSQADLSVDSVRINSIQQGKRFESDIQLIADKDSINFSISRPIESDLLRLPVIIVLGGFQSGKKSLEYISEKGANIFLAPEYPVRRTNFNKEKPLAEIERLRIALLKIPLYLTVTVNWLKQQNGIDTNRISLLGYSFGALVLPAVQHHLQETGFYPAATIISYGAVNIAELLEFNFSGQSTWLNPISSHLLQSLIYPIEPEMHLPELKGQFLLMNGKLDKRIPFQNALKLQELVRQPKTIINLDEGHMHPDKPELTLKIIRISKDWLFEKRLINQ